MESDENFHSAHIKGNNTRRKWSILVESDVIFYSSYLRETMLMKSDEMK